MSAEGQAFVEERSPYTGTAYLIHLRMGMLANETYGYRLFTGDKKLAQMCRCSTKTLQRARAKMIEDGYLTVVANASGQSVAEYRFEFPKVGGHPVQPDEEVGGHSVQSGWTSCPSRWTSEESSPINGIKGIKEESNVVVSEHFFRAEELCSILQRHVVANGFKPFSEGVLSLRAMERLLRIDGHSPEQVKYVIEWCQKDEFWLGNIRSPQKLRQKFDTLFARATQGKRGVLNFVSREDEASTWD